MAHAHNDWYRVAIVSVAGVCAISLALSLSPLSKYSGFSLLFSKPSSSSSGAPAAPATSTTTAPGQGAKPQAPKNGAGAGRPNPAAGPSPRQTEKQRDPGAADKKAAQPKASGAPATGKTAVAARPPPKAAPSAPPATFKQTSETNEPSAIQHPYAPLYADSHPLDFTLPTTSQNGIDWQREAAASAAVNKLEDDHPGDLDKIISAALMAADQTGGGPGGVEIPDADRLMNKELMAAEMFRQLEEKMPDMSPEQMEMAMQQLSEFVQQQELGQS